MTRLSLRRKVERVPTGSLPGAGSARHLRIKYRQAACLAAPPIANAPSLGAQIHIQTINITAPPPHPAPHAKSVTAKSP